MKGAGLRRRRLVLAMSAAGALIISVSLTAVIASTHKPGAVDIASLPALAFPTTTAMPAITALSPVPARTLATTPGPVILVRTLPVPATTTGLSPGTTLSTAPVPVPPASLSPAYIASVNRTDVTIVPAPAALASTAKVTEGDAINVALSQVPPGSTALAAELVQLSGVLSLHGALAWAVAVRPQGGYGAPDQVPSGLHSAPPSYNFEVVFVNALTGSWIMADEGRGASLGNGE